MIRTLKFAAVVASALVALGASPALAQTSPYVSGTTGYDVSYPNCSAAPSGAFGIVGVNGGRAFSYNSCFASEYSYATAFGTPSAYINTGYSGAYGKNITTPCSSAPSTIVGRAHRQAWSIGCSEADTSYSHAGVTPTMWWLDVETGNSWSTSNLTLNQNAIQGATDRFTALGFSVGVYSDASFWQTITGPNGWTPNGLAAEWLAAGPCPTQANPNTGFNSAPVWLLQGGTVNGVDSDTAC